jgi:tetratricopeptide (TPR) repeat protein
LPQAEEYYRQALAVDEKTFGESNPELAGRLQNLGVVLTRQKKFADAEEFLRKAISLKLLQFDPNHWEVATTKNLLGACLVDEKKYKDAEPLLVESYSVIKKQFGLQHDRTRRAGSRLVTLYEASGQKEKAAALRAELGPPK